MGGVVVCFRKPLNPKTPPDMPRVSVSTTGMPWYNRDVEGPLANQVTPEEREAIRYLVKECGWYWTQAGVLRRHKFNRRAA